MWRLLVGLGLACVMAGGCGGSGTPASPSPTATAIAITAPDIVLVGKSVNATAAATLSNGQNQALTTGWRSDAPAVATVTDSGSVTGVANGIANIQVAFGGQQGSKSIRVAPNYSGSWVGYQLMTACSATGSWTGFCDRQENASLMGNLYAIGLTARSAGDLAVAGEFVLAGDHYPTFTSPIESDGSITFTSSIVDQQLHIVVTWQMTQPSAGKASGTIREVYSVTDVPGSMVFESTLSNFFLLIPSGAPGFSPRGIQPTRVPFPGTTRRDRTDRIRTLPQRTAADSSWR
jgi:hypothetical protein